MKKTIILGYFALTLGLFSCNSAINEIQEVQANQEVQDNSINSSDQSTFENSKNFRTAQLIIRPPYTYKTVVLAPEAGTIGNGWEERPGISQESGSTSLDVTAGQKITGTWTKTKTSEWGVTGEVSGGLKDVWNAKGGASYKDVNSDTFTVTLEGTVGTTVKLKPFQIFTPYISAIGRYFNVENFRCVDTTCTSLGKKTVFIAQNARIRYEIKDKPGPLRGKYNYTQTINNYTGGNQTVVLTHSYTATMCFIPNEGTVLAGVVQVKAYRAVTAIPYGPIDFNFNYKVTQNRVDGDIFNANPGTWVMFSNDGFKSLGGQIVLFRQGLNGSDSPGSGSLTKISDTCQ